MAQQQIRFLTPLRGIAALFVALFHWMFWLKDARKVLDAHTSFFDRSYIWVDLFFVLSGFVLMHVYGRRLTGRLDGAALRAFLRARFARIYPMYLFSLLCYLAFVLTLRGLGVDYEALKWGDRFSAPAFVSNLLMAQSFGLHSDLTWNMAAWSVSAEFAVYLLFPLMVPAMADARGRAMLAAVALASFIVIYSIQGDVNITHDFGVFRCLAEVVFGMFLFRVERPWRPLAGGAWPACLLLLGVLAGLNLPRAVVPDALIVLCFGLLILCLAHYRGTQLAWLESRPLVWLGERSYSFYLNHFIMVELVYVLYSTSVSKRLDWHPGLGGGFTFLALVLGANLLVSAFTFALVEQPGRAWLGGRARAAAPMLAQGSLP